MDTIVWLVYGAQVSDVLTGWMVAIGLITLAVTGLMWLVPRAVVAAQENDGPYVTAEQVKNHKLNPFNVRQAVVAVAILVAGGLLPGKHVFYALAATHFTKDIANTELATDAQKAVHKWISDQLDHNKK